MEADPLPLIAYHRGSRPRMRLVPASRWRDWMNETVGRNANRCLPLLMANEAGWLLLNEQRFAVTWDGGEGASSLEVAYEGRRPEAPAQSLFGYGIVSFGIPYLFRTPPGWDLIVRGPTNMPHDGVAPLDGLVETDWAGFPFTMNWMLTRPGTVTFDEGEPFCMLMPTRRHDLERFVPEVRSAEEGDGRVEEVWDAGMRSRHDLVVKKFLAKFTGEQEALTAWEPEYFRGIAPDGGRAPEHKTKRRLKAFPAAEDDAP